MSELFSETRINGLSLRNRFVRSATWEGMAQKDGTCTSALVDLMRTFAEGQIGLIISSHMYVSRQGQASPWQIGIDTDDRIAPLAEMAAAVHEANGTIVAQIAHAGCFTGEHLTGCQPLALSIVNEADRSKYREASAEDLQRLSADFAAAARRAKVAGFDGVQLHAAHGYLLSQSLSPALNRRTDRYGGSLEKRATLILEVLAAVRQEVGKDYPVLVKVNCEDFLEGGLQVAEAVQIGGLLQDAGIDAIEVSGGTIASGRFSPVRTKITSEEKEAYFRSGSKAYKSALDLPIMLVGGVRSLSLAETLFAEGVADYFSMARPFIREPHLIRRWIDGDRRKATCLSDNQCHEAARAGEGLYCVVDRKKQQDVNG